MQKRGKNADDNEVRQHLNSQFGLDDDEDDEDIAL